MISSWAIWKSSFNHSWITIAWNISETTNFAICLKKKPIYIYIHIHAKEGAIPIALKAFTDDKSKLGYIGSQGPSTADLTPNKIWFPEENLGNTKD